MAEEPLSPDDVVLDGTFTVAHCHVDYRNAFTSLSQCLQDAHDQKEELNRLTAKHIRLIQKDTKHKLHGLVTSLRKLWQAMKLLKGYKSHLRSLFERYGYEDIELIDRIEKSHPCRKELRQITKALRGMAQRKEADIERMSALFRMAMRLAGSMKPLDDLDKKTLSEVLSKGK
jgi:hypothetical protein